MRMIASAATAAVLVLGLTTPAHAVGSRMIEGWPRCIVTKAQAERVGIPKTRRGQLCATPLRARRVPGGLELTRTQWRTESWRFLGMIVDEQGRYVADLVRRPR